LTGSWIQAEGDVKSDSEAGSKAQITLTLNSEASADPELLYGMEKLMA
jgi:hypothetical protein